MARFSSIKLNRGGMGLDWTALDWTALKLETPFNSEAVVLPPHESATWELPSVGLKSFAQKARTPYLSRHLRELFKIDASDYMLSICGNDALKELISPGKSGNMFYVSHDDRFYISYQNVDLILGMGSGRYQFF